MKAAQRVVGGSFKRRKGSGRALAKEEQSVAVSAEGVPGADVVASQDDEALIPGAATLRGGTAQPVNNWELIAKTRRPRRPVLVASISDCDTWRTCVDDGGRGWEYLATPPPPGLPLDLDAGAIELTQTAAATPTSSAIWKPARYR